MTELSPLRADRVGSSEVASLFGAGYLSRYELHMLKAGKLPDEPPGPERLEIGRVIESAIAELVKSRLELVGRNVRRAVKYRAHPSIEHSGASLDYQLVGLTGNTTVEKLIGRGVPGPGVLEIKNVSDWAFRKNWERGEVVPLGYQLQVQQQLSVTGWDWGLIAALVGGNHLHLAVVSRHAAAIQGIEREIPVFWTGVENDEPPSPDWEKDAAAVIRIRSAVDTELTLDLTDDARAGELAESFALWRDVEKEARTAKQAKKAELEELHLQGAAVIHLPAGVRVTRRRVKRAPSVVRGGEYTTFNLSIPKERHA